MTEQEYRKCPFCGEIDFDLPGLKAHLQKDCASFDLVDAGGIVFPFSEHKTVRVPKEPTVAMLAVWNKCGIANEPFISFWPQVLKAAVPV